MMKSRFDSRCFRHRRCMNQWLGVARIVMNTEEELKQAFADLEDGEAQKNDLGLAD